MELRKLNKDMLIELIIKLNDFEKMSSEDLKEKRNKIDTVLNSRKNKDKYLERKKKVLEDEDLQREFSVLRSQAASSNLKLVNKKNDEISFIWKNDNPVDMILIHNGKDFCPTDDYLFEISHGYRFLHYREKENLYDLIVICKGSGKTNDPYDLVLANRVEYSNIWFDEYHQKCDYEEWMYKN